MTFQDFLMNSPDGGLMIKVGDGAPIGGLPPWIASDPVNGGLMFKVNNTGGGGSVNTGVLQISGGGPLGASLQNITDQAGNASTLWLSSTATELRGVFALNNGTKKVNFDYSLIATTDKTITIPNATGTMALTSDIPAVADGVLQVLDGFALSSSLQVITDQASTQSALQLSTQEARILGGVKTGTGSLYKPFTIGYSNSTISVTDLDLFSFGAIANGSGRYSAVLRLGGGSDTTSHYIYAGDNSTSTGIILNRGNGATGIFASGGVLIGDATFAGSGAASARLHVKGDGSNPIARFEDNTGSPMLRIENSLMRFGASTPFGSLQFAMTGTTISSNNNGTGLGFYSQFSVAGSSDRYDFGFGGDAVANTAGVVSHLALVRNFAAGAGSASFRPLNIAYTINNSGAQSGTATGIFLNATEDALNSMTHNLMDLQIGGISKFRVSPTLGEVTTAYNVNAAVFLGTAASMSGSGGYKVGSSRIKSGADGIILLQDDAASSFTMLQFGGTSNAFPALKRSSAELQVILADGVSGYANLRVNAIYTEGGAYLKDNNAISGAGDGRISFKTWSNMVLNVSDNGTHIVQGSYTANNASSILELTSTTKGFLVPRMTTTEVNTIPTPADGLIVYNTTISHLCVYLAGTWSKLSHSPM